MTKRKASSQPASTDDLRAEYDLDYSKSRPNRFAADLEGRVVAVILDPDVAAVFDTSEAVNHALRSVMAARSADDASAPSGAGRQRRG